jgi:putative ABC transport system substrate-binding protein
VAFLSGATAQPWMDAFPDAMRELGWGPGSVTFEYRYAEGRDERLPQLAADLVSSQMDVIVAADTPSALAVQAVSRTVAIVTVMASDPVGSGLVAGLGRPGGNVTGLTTLSSQASEKRLELLTEVVPGITQVGILGNFGNPGKVADLEQSRVAGQALGLNIQALDVRAAEQLEGTFEAAARGGAEAVAAVGDPLLTIHRDRIAELALLYRLPTIFETADMAAAGGLMSYGVNREDMFRRAASYTDRILKGANPAELPMEPARAFDLVINLATAQALGLTVPPSVLARADQVIR